MVTDHGLSMVTRRCWSVVWKGWESPKRSAPAAVLGGNQQRWQGSLWAWRTSKPYKTLPCGPPRSLHVSHSLLIHWPARALLSPQVFFHVCLQPQCHRTKSRVIMSRYQPLAPPTVTIPPHLVSTTPLRGTGSCSSSTDPSALLNINLLCPFPPAPHNFSF